MDDLRNDSDADLLRRLRKLVQISANDSFPLAEPVYDYFMQIGAEIVNRQSRTTYLSRPATPEYPDDELTATFM
jgi:hypothetical protein